jgi:hypothetical protein
MPINSFLRIYKFQPEGEAREDLLKICKLNKEKIGNLESLLRLLGEQVSSKVLYIDYGILLDRKTVMSHRASFEREVSRLQSGLDKPSAPPNPRLAPRFLLLCYLLFEFTFFRLYK